MGFAHNVNSCSTASAIGNFDAQFGGSLAAYDDER
jgi:hypothetical protein